MRFNLVEGFSVNRYELLLEWANLSERYELGEINKPNGPGNIKTAVEKIRSDLFLFCGLFYGRQCLCKGRTSCMTFGSYLQHQLTEGVIFD